MNVQKTKENSKQKCIRANETDNQTDNILLTFIRTFHITNEHVTSKESVWLTDNNCVYWLLNGRFMLINGV